MAEVTITLRTIDESSATTKKVKDNFDKVKDSVGKMSGPLDGLKNHLAGLINPTTLAVAGFTALTATVKSSFGDFQKYAGEVRDLSIATGTTAEKSSVLLQVLDDFQISAGDVSAAMRAMKEKGLVPTIDTLADLSDQFLAIEDPAKRLQFAQDNLGRSYGQFLNVLNQGGDVIRDNAQEVNKSLILTDEQIKKAEQERLAVDAVADAWQGFKIQLGSAVGEMILANQELGNNLDRLKDLDAISGKTHQNYRFLTDDQKATIAQLERGAAMTDYYKERLDAMSTGLQDNTDAMGANGEAIGMTAEQLQELSDKNEALHDLMGDFQDIAEGYQEKMEDLKTSESELLAEKQKLIDQGYSLESEKINDINQKLSENIAKQDEAAKAAEDATKRRIISMVEAGMMADKQLSGQEFDALLKLETGWGLMSDEAATAAKGTYDAVQNYLITGDVDAFTSSVDNASKALTNLPSEKTLTLNIDFMSNGTYLPPEQVQQVLNALSY